MYSFNFEYISLGFRSAPSLMGSTSDSSTCSLSTISLHKLIHSSQIYTELGPAISLLTSDCVFPQNEQ